MNGKGLVDHTFPRLRYTIQKALEVSDVAPANISNIN